MIPPYHIAVYTITYAAFFTLLSVSSKHHGNRLLDERGIVSNRYLLLLLHLGGIVLMGSACCCFLDQSPLVIILGKNPASSLSVLLAGILMVAALIIAPADAGKKYVRFKINRAEYIPFSRSFIINYFLTRVTFLFVYETWFRGYLLTDCIKSLGIPRAIIVNVILYCLLHVVNGKREVYGCVPLGLIFCGLSVMTGAAWPAILLHIVITVSHELHLVKKINKPSISFV